MSTRASVVVKTADGYVCYYHHHDGYLEYLGLQLLCYIYTSYHKAYIEHGDPFNLNLITNILISQLDSDTGYEKEDDFYNHSDDEYLYYIAPKEYTGRLGGKNEDLALYAAGYTIPCTEQVMDAFTKHGLKHVILTDKLNQEFDLKVVTKQNEFKTHNNINTV